MIIAVPLQDALRIWMQGAIAIGYLVVAIFFIQFWLETHERVFLFFATGFVVLTIHRALLGLANEDLDWRAVTFSLRLAGYVIILIGIIDRRSRSRS
jgi:uncharacterized membrane protein